MATKARSDEIRNGRYIQGGTTEQFRERLGWWDRRLFSRSATDVPFKITPRYGKRPDLLAYDMYGQVSLGWLILQYNYIVDINEEFIEGVSIILPTRERVLTEFLTRPLVV